MGFFDRVTRREHEDNEGDSESFREPATQVDIRDASEIENVHTEATDSREGSDIMSEEMTEVTETQQAELDTSGQDAPAATQAQAREATPKHEEPNRPVPPTPRPAGVADGSPLFDERLREKSPLISTLALLAQEANRSVEREMTLRQRIRELEGVKSQFESVLREIERVRNGLAVTEQQVQEMQDVMEALEEDPNHVLVLNSLARYAPVMLVLISEYESLKELVDRH